MNRPAPHFVLAAIASTAIGLGLTLATIILPPKLSAKMSHRSDLTTTADRTYAWVDLYWWDQTVTMVDTTITLPNEGFMTRYWIDGRRFRTPDRRFELPIGTPPRWVRDSMQLAKYEGVCDVVAVGWPWRCAFYQRAPYPTRRTRIVATLGDRLASTSVMPNVMWVPLIGNVAALSVLMFGAIVAVLKVRLVVRRHRRTGHCSTCNYPQLPQSTKCPECGTSTNAG